MKASTVLVALAGALSTMVEARACTEGLNYCGKYQSEIDNELKRVNLPVQSPYDKNSLFHCGSDGWIRWNVYCGNCVDGGGGRSDYCR
nr:uncharacterized protein CTRU02_11173 [Colletotrichum truncatum]KAF6786302.1 hypothetical protein CTRU02_11173 [Colletotrichum truncatum]